MAGIVLNRRALSPGDVPAAQATAPSFRRLVRTTSLWLAIWLLPVGLILLRTGWSSVFSQQARFFSSAAVVTFGGAYAVLAYVAQRAVEVYGWLLPGEMLDGLGLAETTPGPLIMVVQFVGFLGAFRQPGGLDPTVAGILGSVVATWVTFAPSFLFIFAGAPYVEYLRGRRALTAALRGIMAAVVGVVLNLAVWFAIHTLFRTVESRAWGVLQVPVPALGSVEWSAVLLAVGAAFAVFRLRLGLFAVLGGAALAGVVIRTVAGLVR
jgi:chromate transporter